MPITFPSNPVTNQTYSSGELTWSYNGKAWELATSGGGATVTIRY